MTYSCTDFVDTILDALKIVVPEEAQDDPSAQADLASAAIEGLKDDIRALGGTLQNVLTDIYSRNDDAEAFSANIQAANEILHRLGFEMIEV